MDFFTLIERRRSVRAFQARPIEEEKVRRLLRAAQRAPSAGNLQAVEVFAPTRPEVKQALAQAAWDQMFIARQAPLVLETLVMFSGVDLSAKAIRQQILGGGPHHPDLPPARWLAQGDRRDRGFGHGR
ncbi:MAG TPA: nitroreductase family protein [Anaerolineaceae bacterium]|nr:nitroreductase family protein [Anaerolineales bacterium]HIQ08787.1 nitroreductase family protein [Anaerolineaceae bacterium]